MKRKSYDIYSGSLNSIESGLSNFNKYPFYMDGYFICSLEGFIQGLKFESIEDQKHVFSLHGISALNVGRTKRVKNNTIYYNGTPINRYTDAYKRLMYKAYILSARSNERFMKLLEASKGVPLDHSMHHNDKEKTLLTTKEFIDILDFIRDNIETIKRITL